MRQILVAIVVASSLFGLGPTTSSPIAGTARSLSGSSARHLAHPALRAWVQRGFPVLVADQSWEGGVVQEPTVLQLADGSFVMFYSGGWYDCTMGMAVSVDGLRWVKRGRVLGDGVGGELHKACHSSVSLVDGTFYAFYSAAWLDGHTWTGFGTYYATSPDGFNWQARGLALATGSWDLNPANTQVWVEHGVWYMLYDTATTSPALWLMTLAIGTGPASWVKTNHVLEPLSLGGAAQCSRSGESDSIDVPSAGRRCAPRGSKSRVAGRRAMDRGTAECTARLGCCSCHRNTWRRQTTDWVGDLIEFPRLTADQRTSRGSIGIAECTNVSGQNRFTAAAFGDRPLQSISAEGSPLEAPTHNRLVDGSNPSRPTYSPGRSVGVFMEASCY